VPERGGYRTLSQDKALAMVAHIEGAGGFDAQGDDLQAFYRAGVRSIGPFWNIANRFGCGVTGAFPGSPDSGPGLTGEGIALIAQANALKMQIDVSHMNEQAFWDTAHHSTARWWPPTPMPTPCARSRAI
jgi:membrane dipeptidase